MAIPLWHHHLAQHFVDQRALAVFHGFESTDAWREAGPVQRRRARRAIERVTGGKLPWDEALDRVRLPIAVLGPCREVTASVCDR